MARFGSRSTSRARPAARRPRSRDGDRTHVNARESRPSVRRPHRRHPRRRRRAPAAAGPVDPPLSTTPISARGTGPARRRRDSPRHPGIPLTPQALRCPEPTSLPSMNPAAVAGHHGENSRDLDRHRTSPIPQGSAGEGSGLNQVLLGLGGVFAARTLARLGQGFRGGRLCCGRGRLRGLDRRNARRQPWRHLRHGLGRRSQASIDSSSIATAGSPLPKSSSFASAVSSSSLKART